MKYARTLLSTILIFATNYVFAGVPQTTMECKSASGNATISGYPDGEGFDLKIQIDKSVIRYTNACDDTDCPTKDNYGNLTVVDALFNNVFTISFANSDNNNRGIFYALPGTVKYKKDAHGYTSQYKGIYWGDDPRSNEPFKAFVKDQGIELQCTQKNFL